MLNKKILVTGVAGFIGSNLADRLLQAGYEVIGIDNLAYGLEKYIPKGVDFRMLDVRSKDIYSAFEGVEAVFHLAAKNDLIACQNDPVETMDINVHGTANVFEAAKCAGVKKIIFASSSAVEEGEDRIKGFYAISKVACEKIAEGYRAAWGINYVLLRYFNVYGPRQDYRRLPHPPVISEFILKAFNNEQPVFYEGYEKDGRDFIYVDDLNDFHLLCLTTDAVNNKILRVGTGQSSSIKEIWETIKKELGSTLEPVIKPGPEGHIPVMTKADMHETEAVGWHPKTSLSQGLKAQIDFLKAEVYDKK